MGLKRGAPLRPREAAEEKNLQLRPIPITKMGGEDVAKAGSVQKYKRKRREYWLPHQRTFDKFYNSLKVQFVVALLIGANFLTNIVEKEIDPAGTKYKDTFQWFEL